MNPRHEAAVSRTRVVRAHDRAQVPRVALTPAEAAEALGCSAEFFREHIDLELRWIRRGRKRFVPVVELERWAEANAEATL
jgi:excisionase family DNA binding protein